jgi:hypothetical protein
MLVTEQIGRIRTWPWRTRFGRHVQRAVRLNQEHYRCCHVEGRRWGLLVGVRMAVNKRSLGLPQTTSVIEWSREQWWMLWKACAKQTWSLRTQTNREAPYQYTPCPGRDLGSSHECNRLRRSSHLTLRRWNRCVHTHTGSQSLYWLSYSGS